MLYKGLTKDSFLLKGYLRDRYVIYEPEIMEPYDFGCYDSYILYSPNHSEWSYLPPLRMEDIILVYRVNPLLINWELHVKPQAKSGTSNSFGPAVYEPKEQETCDAIFKFAAIRNGVTGATITYNR